MHSKQIRVINGPRNKRSTTVHIYMSMVTSILSLVQNKPPPSPHLSQMAPPQSLFLSKMTPLNVLTSPKWPPSISSTWENLVPKSIPNPLHLPFIGLLLAVQSPHLEKILSPYPPSVEKSEKVEKRLKKWKKLKKWKS